MKLPVILILVMLAHYSFACSCEHPKSVLKAFHDSDVILQGRITSVSTVPLSEALKENTFHQSDNEPFSNSAVDVLKVEVRLVHSFKGIDKPVVTIFTPISETICGYSAFKKGREYIIYGTQNCFLLDKNPSASLPDTYWTNQCTRTNIYTDEEKKALNSVLESEKTFYYSDFNLENLQEIITYVEENEFELSWIQSNDLQAAQQLNHYLNMIEYGSYMDVGFYFDKNGIQQTNFYFNGKKATELSKKTSPLQVYYQNINSRVVLQATVNKDFFESMKICYASNYNRVILANWQNNQIDGYYTEYDINGMVRVEGKYKQVSSEPHPVDYSDLPYSFWNKRDTTLIVSKSSVKTGTWFYYDNEGNLQREESF